MKIDKNAIAEMKKACDAFIAEHPGYTEEYYVTNKIGRNHLMRFRWDILQLSKYDICSLYKIDGVNDTHIDSALRQIFGHKQ